jgi:hypothetical protein
MSWLSELFGGGSSTGAVATPPSQFTEADWNSLRPVEMGGTPNPRAGGQVPGYYESIRQYDPKWIAMQNAAPPAPPPDAPAPTPAPAPVGGGPEEALQKLNAALGSGFENTYLPDTLDDPFINTALAKGRSSADSFIANMLKRGTLSGPAEAKARAALDAQTPGVTSRLGGIGSTLLGTDRTNLTNFANTQRGVAQQTPAGADFDPTPLVNQIAQTGQGYAGTFGDRFNAAIPAGELYDTSGIGSLSGAVTSPKNVAYDPYAVEGGKLKSGLEDAEAPAPKKKRTTEVF